jgi:hypothetical protein
LLRVPLPLHQERAPLRHSALPRVIWQSRPRYRFGRTPRSDQ